MALLAETFTGGVPTYPPLTDGERRLIAQTNEEIGVMLHDLAPPIGGYLFYPIVYEANDHVITISGVARYEHPTDEDKVVSAYVTRDTNNEVHLKTEITQLRQPGESVLVRGELPKIRPGVYLTAKSPHYEYPEKLVYRVVGDGREHFKGNPITLDQWQAAWSGVLKTIGAISEANVATYGVSGFSHLSHEELGKVREHAEPGLLPFYEEAWTHYRQEVYGS